MNYLTTFVGFGSYVSVDIKLHIGTKVYRLIATTHSFKEVHSDPEVIGKSIDGLISCLNARGFTAFAAIIHRELAWARSTSEYTADLLLSYISLLQRFHSISIGNGKSS